MKKIALFLILLLMFSGCKKTYISYNYSGFSIKRMDKTLKFIGYLMNNEDNNSYVRSISIFESGAQKRPTILTTPIKIITKNKEYRLKEKKGTITTYLLYENGVKINSDSFIVEFGKIKLENGQIIELPPIKFRKYVNSKRWNVVWDALNQDTPTEEIFQGTIEEYREWKRRNK